MLKHLIFFGMFLSFMCFVVENNGLLFFFFHFMFPWVSKEMETFRPSWRKRKRIFSLVPAAATTTNFSVLFGFPYSIWQWRWLTLVFRKMKQRYKDGPKVMLVKCKVSISITTGNISRLYKMQLIKKIGKLSLDHLIISLEMWPSWNML